MTSADDTVDLRLLLNSFWAHRWWVAFSIIVSSAAFSLIALNLTPTYRASTVLVSTSGERNSLSGALGAALVQVGSLAGLAGIASGGGDGTTEEALAVLRSRQFTERFITELNLLPTLFPKEWDAAAGKWKVANHKRPTLAKAAKYFAEDIRMVTQDPKTRLVTVRIEWRDPQVAASWANELVKRLNAELRTRAITRSKASVAFLERELMSTSALGTKEAINRLIETQMRERMLANVTHEYAFRVVDIALPPDIDDPVRSSKLLLLLAGPVLGFVVGLVVARVRESMRLQRQGAPS